MNIMSYFRINLLLICLMFGIPAEGTILGKSSDLNFVYDAATGKYISQFATADEPGADDAVMAAAMSFNYLNYPNNSEFTVTAYSNPASHHGEIYDSWPDAVDIANSRIYFRESGYYLTLSKWGHFGPHSYNPAGGYVWPRIDGTKYSLVWSSGHDNPLTGTSAYSQTVYIDLSYFAADSYLDFRFKGINTYGAADISYNYAATSIIYLPTGDLSDLPSMEMKLNTTFTLPTATWSLIPYDYTNTPASSADVSWDAVNHRFNLSPGVWLIYSLAGRWINTVNYTFSTYTGFYFYDEGVADNFLPGGLSFTRSNYDSSTDNTLYDFIIFVADSTDDQVGVWAYADPADAADLESGWANAGVIRLRLNE